MNKPINVAIPNTAKEKMIAISAVARAIENVSKALISVQVEVMIANNTITGAENGININIEEKI